MASIEAGIRSLNGSKLRSGFEFTIDVQKEGKLTWMMLTLLLYGLKLFLRPNVNDEFVELISVVIFSSTHTLGLAKEVATLALIY